MTRSLWRKPSTGSGRVLDQRLSSWAASHLLYSGCHGFCRNLWDPEAACKSRSRRDKGTRWQASHSAQQHLWAVKAVKAAHRPLQHQGQIRSPADANQRLVNSEHCFSSSLRVSSLLGWIKREHHHLSRQRWASSQRTPTQSCMIPHSNTLQFTQTDKAATARPIILKNTKH